MNSLCVSAEKVSIADIVTDLANETSNSTNYIVTSKFIEYYYGYDSLLVLNRIQKEEHKNYLENLTKKYTNQPAITNCVVKEQINVTDRVGTISKRGCLLIIFTMDFSEDIKGL